MSKAPKKIRKQKKEISWSKFKVKLAKRSSWLDGFTKSAVAQAIVIIKTKPRNYYEPLLVETTLKEASEALDRCLAFRREAYELEIAAVKAAADYQLFEDLADRDEKLETNALAIPRLKVEEPGYRKASETYKLDKGFNEHDETLADSVKENLNAANERQNLLKERWTIRRKYEEEYHKRHEAHGNAHNFAERLERMIPLLADDLQEAYEKLLAVHTGIKAIYGKDISPSLIAVFKRILASQSQALPELEGEEALDKLVHWARAAIQFLDIERQQESEYELVIPLTQKWRFSEKPIVPPEELAAAVNKQGHAKIISFDLSDVFFNQERVRLRSVGLAFGQAPIRDEVGEMDRLGYWRVRATIHTPKQPDVMNPGSYYMRPPIVLGDVAQYGRSLPVAKRFGPECHNVDPRGEWKIVLNKYSVWSDDQTRSIEGTADLTVVADLKLYLSVVARPSPDADSVFTPKQRRLARHVNSRRSRRLSELRAIATQASYRGRA